VGNFLAHEPSVEWLQVTAPAWAIVRTARGMGGYHVYSYFDDTWLCSPSVWMPTDRDILLVNTLAEAGVRGLAWVATETAAGRGDRPVNAQTISDIACYIRQIDKRPAVWGGALWTSGRVGSMEWAASLDGWMMSIARTVG
jgi:hypothetical protein